MTDQELIQNLSDWCDCLRRTIEEQIRVNDEQNRRLRLALTSWDMASARFIKKEKS